MTGRGERRRPHAALLVVATVVIVAGAALLALRMKWRGDLSLAVARFEEEVGSLDPVSLPPRTVAASENAASWLEAAGAALVLDREGSLALELARQPLAGWTPEQVERARALVAGHPEVLALLARAVPLDQSSFGARYVPEAAPIDDTSIGGARPVPDPAVDLLRQIRLSRFVRVAVGVALLDGECALAEARSALTARQARALLAERMLLFGLVGTAVHRALVDDVAELAARCREVEPLERALASLERVERDAFMADEVLRGEGVSSLAQMPRLLARGGRLWGPIARERRFALQARMIDHWREMVLAVRGGRPALREWSDRQRERNARSRGPLASITAMLTPNLVDAAEKMILREAAGRAARAALWLRIVGLRDGAYPGAAALPEELRAPTRSFDEQLGVVALEGGGVEVGYPIALDDWRARRGDSTPAPRLLLGLPPL
jgi:hypothetical protein